MVIRFIRKQNQDEEGELVAIILQVLMICLRMSTMILRMVLRIMRCKNEDESDEGEERCSSKRDSLCIVSRAGLDFG